MSIQTEIERLQGAKADIKTAIENKGVTVPSSEKIDNYDTYINQIQGNLQEKTVTPDALGQTVLPDPSYDGLSQVVVNGDTNLIPSNVLKDVTIFGTTGTVEPYVAPVLQSKSATPNAIGQTVTADTGYDGLSSVSIDGDYNLSSENIKKDVSIFGVTGTLDPHSEPTLQSKSVTPSASGQTVTPDTGYDGLSSVTVSGDGNLVSGNIKKNVSIFGVTGNYEGSGGGGSSDYNVYMQRAEPENKDGIWIKKNGTKNVKFVSNSTSKGHFITGNFDFMNFASGTTFLGHVIVGDILYHLGTTPSTSYKVNIRTGENLGTINTKDIGQWGGGVSTKGTTNYYATGAVFNPEDRCIYAFWVDTYDYYYVRGYKYNIETNNSSFLTTAGTNASRAGNNSACAYYNGATYVLNTQGNAMSPRYNEITNMKTKAVSNTTYDKFSKYCYDGKYIYTLYVYYSTMNVKRIDLTSATTTTIYTISSTYGTPTQIFVKGDFLYIFYANKSDVYTVYNMNTGVTKNVTTGTSFTLTSDTQLKHWFVLDDVYGVLYFRSPGKSTIGFQLENNAIAGLDNGTQLIIQDFSTHITKIEDESNLRIGVQDAFVKENDELAEYMTCWGDGEKWNVLKNPNFETCVVTFDSNGGSSVTSQTVVCGQAAIEPTEPTKSGYAFDYWLDGEEKYDFSTKLVSDKTLTAKWQEAITVTFDDGQGNITTQEVLSGETATKPSEDPTSSTGIFKYWTLNGTEFDFSTPITAPITLLAEYETFTEISYIESTGIQYIDTGVTGSNNTRIVSSYMVKTVPTSATQLFGNMSTTSAAITYNLKPASDAISRWGNASYTGSFANVVDTRYEIDCSASGYYLDSTLVWTPTANTFTTNGTLWLFAAKGGNGKLIGRVYSCQIYNNGTLVRNFQPIKTASGEYCLFDKVENRAYHNAGTGSFRGAGWEPTLVSYIESSGTQYIDTGVIPYSTKFEATFSVTQVVSTGANIYLAGVNNSDNRYYPFLYDTSNSTFMTADKSNTKTTLGSFDTNTHTLIYNDENNKVYYDGTEKTTITDVSQGGANSLVIFSFSSNGTVSANNMIPARLYRCKITDKTTGTLVRDFAPALDHQGVACLWDKVTETFYYNAGTGTFDYGESLPTGYTELSYIESTGTQYIDTGVLPYKTQTEITFQTPTQPSSGCYVAACYNANDNRYYPLGYSYSTGYWGTISRNNTNTDLAPYDSNTHTIIYNDSNNLVYYDGVQKATISDLTVQATNTLYLFATHNSSGVAANFYSGRIKSVKITDKTTNTLIRNFVPAKRNSDDAIGLYDTVNNVFYTNQGTGSFTGA